MTPVSRMVRHYITLKPRFAYEREKQGDLLWCLLSLLVDLMTHNGD